ncbi:hypothetical protein AMTRI_Chr10g229660 [Amborella trichopoda]
METVKWIATAFAPRLVKLDFSCFNGEEDTTNWTCRVEQFFQFHQTPEEERVALASFHSEGDAQLWYQLFKQEGDFFRELAKLQQVVTVRDYQTQFEINYFISGLKDNIKADMLAGHPTTLSTAIRLARL